MDPVQWIPLDFDGVHWTLVESVGVRKVLPDILALSIATIIVCLLELDKCMSVEGLLEIVQYSPDPTCLNMPAMSSHHPSLHKVVGVRPGNA